VSRLSGRLCSSSASSAVAIAACCIVGLASAPARADESASARRAAAAREMNRPYTMAELTGSLLTLPAANVCLTAGNCSRGETSIAVGLHNFYRSGILGIGAGIVYARTLRGDAAPGQDDPDLQREHTRGYFMVEGQLRLYALRAKSWEWWVGPSVGAVIVNDSWSVIADRKPYADTAFIGPRAATIGTEGLTAGLGLGAEWSFANNWSFGAMLRYAMWFLPQNAERSPTGDTASLSGRVDMVDLGLTVAYRIAL
jgi:hypothetical protein